MNAAAPDPRGPLAGLRVLSAPGADAVKPEAGREAARHPAGAAIPATTPTGTDPTVEGGSSAIAGNSGPILRRMRLIGRPDHAADPRLATADRPLEEAGMPACRLHTLRERAEDPLLGRIPRPGPALPVPGRPPEASAGWTGPAVAAQNALVPGRPAGRDAAKAAAARGEETAR